MSLRLKLKKRFNEAYLSLTEEQLTYDLVIKCSIVPNKMRVFKKNDVLLGSYLSGC